jgi:hypothetical protein
MLGKGILVPRPSQGSLSSSGSGEILLIHYNFFFLNFEHLELSLEGSRLIVCTRVVKLVVMVTSPHLSYMFFFVYLSSSEAC